MANTTWNGTKFASKFEADFAKHLTKIGVEWEYEPDRFKWLPPARVYIPDFKITLEDGSVFYIEAKGYFDGSARAKMACVKKQHPSLDVRFFFMNPNNKIGAKAKKPTRYWEWAEKYGFPWAAGEFPREWRKRSGSANGKSNPRGVGRTRKSKKEVPAAS